MRIGVLSPSIYMYQKKYAHRIYAPGKLAIDFVDGLVDKGHEVFFFTASDVITKATLISEDIELLDAAYTLDDQQDLSPDLNGIVSLYETKKYYELGLTQKAFSYARENNLDVVHIFHAFSNFSHYFESESKIITLYTLHSPPPSESTFEYWRYKKFADRNFIAISEMQKKIYKEQIPEITIQDVAYNGIRIEEFPLENQSDSYVAFIGRLLPEKGLDVAISVVGQTEYNLKIATQLNPVVEKSDYYLKKIVPHLTDSKINLVGFVEGEEKSAFLGKAKVFLFPLQWEEPFGLVMIEAMSCGTPVIAYNRGSVSEVIKDGVTGFIIDPDDQDRPGNGSWVIKQKGTEGLKEAIKRIGEIDRRACRAHVEQNFTIKTMVDGYEKIYNELLDKKRK